MSYPYLIQGQTIIIVIDNVIHTVNKSHLNYDKIINAIKTFKWDVIKSLVDVVGAVVDFSKGNITIIGEQLFWNNEEMHSSVAKRTLEMYKEGFDIRPMVAFMENIMNNPSKASANELYEFLEACSLPITPDGHFLAYKKVTNDYKDCYTKKLDNSIGKVVSMPRTEVNANRNETCSHGLHFCSLNYLKDFAGARTVILKINPADVVSIPVDYNNSKGRCSKYEVIGEVNGKAEEAFTKPVQMNAKDNDTPEQLYDSKGRALSMTPNAIRKRAARAKKSFN